MLLILTLYSAVLNHQSKNSNQLLLQIIFNTDHGRIEDTLWLTPMSFLTQIPHSRSTGYKRSRLSRNKRTVNRAYSSVLFVGEIVKCLAKEATQAALVYSSTMMSSGQFTREPAIVVKGFEAVVRYLQKAFIDHGVLPLYETTVDRPLSTDIYFSLPTENVSNLHRSPSAETWHFYLGEPITILEIDDKNGSVEFTNM
ncbi:rmlC-like jelly roll fold protein [Artemisia annua]|uniref:RmlC-like jelly roll fold protein n=1 Tax=Artemisia annua TaxID=35608 RepID=A0A2U1M5P8_ARTAN|nr:rmlC-like jelly roll fold protein [Artemisia annua]